MISWSSYHRIINCSGASSKATKRLRGRRLKVMSCGASVVMGEKWPIRCPVPTSEQHSKERKMFPLVSCIARTCSFNSKMRIIVLFKTCTKAFRWINMHEYLCLHTTGRKTYPENQNTNSKFVATWPFLGSFISTMLKNMQSLLVLLRNKYTACLFDAAALLWVHHLVMALF